MHIFLRLFIVVFVSAFGLLLLSPVPRYSAAASDQVIQISLPVPTVVPTDIPFPTFPPLSPTPVVELKGESGGDEVSRMYDFINSYREAHGKGKLTVSSLLVRSAYAKAQDMIAGNYFSHVSPGGKRDWDFIKGAGYDFSAAGENLADNYFTAQQVIDAWKASGPHNENLLRDNFGDMGIAFICNVKFHLYESTCLTVLHLGRN